MPAWLNAWAGDNAGEVHGRQPYQALVTVNYTDTHLPMALFEKGDLDGTTWYYNIWMECLTPGVMAALVTNVDFTKNCYALDITPYQWSGGNKAEWQPGVHLVAIEMLGANANMASAIATVVVPPKSKFKRAVKLSDMAATQVMSQRRMLSARR